MPGSDPLELPPPVLDEALAKLVAEEGTAREQVLDELIAAHPEHRDELRALYETLAGANRMLARTFSDGAPQAEPSHIDRYAVVRRLGEGAFGVVYLCEQREPIRRLVAIKVLRPGAGDRGTLARFHSERRFLARLHHPSIAQIFDAGLLPDGRPWFVMEHVPGVPLTDYCDRAQLPIEARLSLFARLCQGVQHAHEQGIVHRDLKPANVLVVEIDGEAQPKIIDFGIGKALEHTSATVAHTEPGRVVGTPGYMSPEQAAGNLADVDARSDLFSLGVILYELLTGELPWGKRPDSTASDPPLPSRRIATGTQHGTDVAQHRRTQPRRLARHLRGDLDWIVLKALSRERSHRYASALDLAAEVQRHLRGEPVHAGPPSLTYRLRKFARRRRTALANAAAGVVLVVVGIWLLGAYRAEAHSRGQDAESAVANLLARANDDDLVDKPGAESVRKTLAEDALAFYDQFLRERPEDLTSRERRAKALWTLSQVHWLLGEFARSETMAREAVADGEALLAMAPANADYQRTLARAERNLGRAIFSRGRQPEARPHFERAVALLERIPVTEPGVGTGDLVRALDELYSTMGAQDEPEAADAVLLRASELQEQRVRKNPDHTGERDSLAHFDLKRAIAALERGDMTEAKERLERPARWLATGAELTPSTAASVHALSSAIAAAEGDLETAIRHRQDAIIVCRASVEREPTKPQLLAQLGGFLVSLSDLQNAASLHDELADTFRAAVELGDTWATRFPEDPRAPDYCTALTSRLVMVLLQSGRRSKLNGAERAARRACELVAKLPESMPRGMRLHREWTNLGNLGLVADALGLPDAADVWRRTATAMAAYRVTEPMTAEFAAEHVIYSLRIAQRELDAGHTVVADTQLRLAQALVDEHRAASTDVAFQASQLAKLRARCAAQRGDLADAAAAAEAAAEGDEFRGVNAALAMSGVWRTAKSRGADASPWRSRAIELCEVAIPGLQAALPAQAGNPWIVVRLAHLQILLALARRDGGATFDSAAVERALDTLATMRDDLHANEWDDEVFTAGKALLAR